LMLTDGSAEAPEAAEGDQGPSASELRKKAKLEEKEAMKEMKSEADKVEKMMAAQAKLEEEIERKRREVEEAVNTERAKLEARLEELQNEADEARGQADAMVLASDKLSQELVKVHEQYDDATKRKRAEKAEMAYDDEPEAEDGEWDLVEEREGHWLKTHDNEAPSKVDLSVWKEQQSGRFQFRAEQEGDRERKMAVSEDLMESLDPENRWVDLFSRVGLSSDDPPRIVVNDLLGEREIAMPPNDAAVLCRFHRFDDWRYYVSGTSMATSFMADFVLTKDDLAADEEISSAINSGASNNTLMDVLLGKLSFQEGDGFFFTGR